MDEMESKITKKELSGYYYFKSQETSLPLILFGLQFDDNSGKKILISLRGDIITNCIWRNTKASTFHNLTA